MRPTWVEIDIANLRHNLDEVRRIVGARPKILVPVKADAYGHGIVEISRALERWGVNYLGVSSVDEGMEIREAGVKLSVLVMGAIMGDEIKPCVENDLTITLTSKELLKGLSDFAKGNNLRPKVHIKIDTGMGRLGVWHTDGEKFIKAVAKCRNIEIEGVYTHFPSADTDGEFTKKQIRDFKALLNTLKKKGIRPKYAHTANSTGLIGFEEAHFNLVRPGLMVYGLYPDMESVKVDIKPVLSFKTKIAYLKEVPKGRPISYGGTYVTTRRTKVATLPVGYGDGYMRHLSNKGEVLIHGKRVPVIGRVSMDHTMVDVTHIDNPDVEDEVVLIGRQGSESIGAEELAQLCGTISYEIVCAISKRVPRLYI